MNATVKKTALITGATSGIGAEYARQFALQGCDLIITGRREEKIRSFAEGLARENKVSVEVILAELSKGRDVDKLLESIADREIEVLVNNAGSATARFFHKEPLSVQEDIVGVNILCLIKLTYAILPQMLRRRRGTIINVSSAGAFLPAPKEATYLGTKAFQRAFSEGLYLELIGTGVIIQAVCPGLTKTDMPIRLGVSEEHLVDRGMFKWSTPKEVVDASMKSLEKNEVVCIPGRLTRLQVLWRHLLPSSLYYKLAHNYYKKYGWLDEE